MKPITGYDHILESYNSLGYAVARIFPEKILTRLRRDVVSILADACHMDVSQEPSSFTSVVRLLRSRLCVIYSSTDNTDLVHVIRQLGTILPLQELAGLEDTGRLLVKLGLSSPVISSPPEFRTDFPNDSKYMQSWHQDWPYTQSSLNSLTIWTPLHDVDVIDGALNLIPGSHKWGVAPVQVELNPRKFTIDNVPLEQKINVPVAYGESLIFSQLLYHCSGENKSADARLSFQLRYADVDDIDWKSSGYYRADKSVSTFRKYSFPSP
jgi:hypothetical protein